MSHIQGSEWLRTRGAAKRIRSIETKPSLLSRAWRSIRIAALRWEIRNDEDWLELCRRNRYEDAPFRRRIGEARVRLAMLEAGTR